MLEVTEVLTPVILKFRQKIANDKKETAQRFAVEKLKDEQISRAYKEKLEEKWQTGTDKAMTRRKMATQ